MLLSHLVHVYCNTFYTLFFVPITVVLHLLIPLAAGEKEIPGLTDSTVPRRLGPKRASKIRKLFNLSKEDDVRQYVVRRPVTKEGERSFCLLTLNLFRCIGRFQVYNRYYILICALLLLHAFMRSFAVNAQPSISTLPSHRLCPNPSSLHTSYNCLVL